MSHREMNAIRLEAVEAAVRDVIEQCGGTATQKQVLERVPGYPANDVLHALASLSEDGVLYVRAPSTLYDLVRASQGAKATSIPLQDSMPAPPFGFAQRLDAVNADLADLLADGCSALLSHPLLARVANAQQAVSQARILLSK